MGQGRQRGVAKGSSGVQRQGRRAGGPHVAQHGLLADGGRLRGLRGLRRRLQVGQRGRLRLLLPLAVSALALHALRALLLLLLLLLLLGQVLLQQVLLGGVAGQAVGQGARGHALRLLRLQPLQVAQPGQRVGGGDGAAAGQAAAAVVAGGEGVGGAGGGRALDGGGAAVRRAALLLLLLLQDGVGWVGPRAAQLLPVGAWHAVQAGPALARGIGGRRAAQRAAQRARRVGQGARGAGPGGRPAQQLLLQLQLRGRRLRHETAAAAGAPKVAQLRGQGVRAAAGAAQQALRLRGGAWGRLRRSRGEHGHLRGGIMAGRRSAIVGTGNAGLEGPVVAGGVQAPPAAQEGRRSSQPAPGAAGPRPGVCSLAPGCHPSTVQSQSALKGPTGAATLCGGSPGVAGRCNQRRAGGNARTEEGLLRLSPC